MRELIKKRVIDKITPVPNSDNLEACHLQGWVVLAHKGEFKENEEVIYVEIDSVLPKWPCFEFLTNRCSKYGGYYIKTIRLRGTYSQGLIVKESDLAPYTFEDLVEQTQHVDALKAAQSEQPTRQDSFPYWITKTDEERIQNLRPPFIPKDKTLEDLFITEKIDGTSATYFIDPDTNEFGFASRNYRLDPAQDPPSVYGEIAQKYKIEEKLRNSNIAWIQGEIVGPGIQKNPLQLTEKQFYVFNIATPENADKLDLPKVPKLTSASSAASASNLEDYNFWLDLANRKSVINPKVKAEGIVVRMGKTQFDKSQSFKVINNDYLLTNT